MEIIFLLALVVAAVLFYRASTKPRMIDSVKSDLEAMARATARGAGKSGALAQNIAQEAAHEAKEAYSESRLAPGSRAQGLIDERVAIYQAIESLKALLDSGAITEDEFLREKSRILDGSRE